MLVTIVDLLWRQNLHLVPRGVTFEVNHWCTCFLWTSAVTLRALLRWVTYYEFISTRYNIFTRSSFSFSSEELLFLKYLMQWKSPLWRVWTVDSHFFNIPLLWLIRIWWKKNSSQLFFLYWAHSWILYLVIKSILKVTIISPFSFKWTKCTTNTLWKEYITWITTTMAVNNAVEFSQIYMTPMVLV